MLIDVSFIKQLINVHVIVAQTLVASRKTKIELDTHAGTFLVGDNCLVIHDYNRPINVSMMT